MLLPLLVHTPVLEVRAAPPPTGPVVYPVSLPPGYYEYFPVDAFANGTVVHYSAVSNSSVSTAFMTVAQFQDFDNDNGPVSNSIAHENGTSVQNTAEVGPGSYAVLVYAYGGSANVTISVSVSPNNPLAYGPLTSPEPTGVASFGLANSSGVDTQYSVDSTDVIGLASITSIRAYNASAGSVGANPSGATIQLNSMLVVDEGGAGSQVYWCQNTPDFVTATSQIAMADNVWNSSASGFLSNDSITSQGGGGYVSTFQQYGGTQYYYAYDETNATYSLPLGLVLLMNETEEPGIGVLVQFGAKATGNLLGEGGTDWFDNVTIHDPAVTDAYFATNGNYSSPIGTFYDTELVFAGEGNGESTSFRSLAASLGLYYANGTGAEMSAFPSYFSFGQDTAESADDLRVSYLGDGGVSVSVGSPNYEYLGAASGSVSLASAEGLLGFPGSANGSSTTAEASTETATQSSSSAPSLTGIPEFPYQAGAAAVFVALAMAAYLAVRRRSMPRGRAWSPEVTERPRGAACPSWCIAQGGRLPPWGPC